MNVWCINGTNHFSWSAVIRKKKGFPSYFWVCILKWILNDEHKQFITVVTVFGGRILRWIISHTPPIICLPYLKFLAIFVSLLGGWIGYELPRVNLRGSLISFFFHSTSFSGSIWFIPYLSLYEVSLSPSLLGHSSLVSDLGWVEHGVSRVNQWCQYKDLKVFLVNVYVCLLA